MHTRRSPRVPSQRRRDQTSLRRNYNPFEYGSRIQLPEQRRSTITHCGLSERTRARQASKCTQGVESHGWVLLAGQCGHHSTIPAGARRLHCVLGHTSVDGESYDTCTHNARHLTGVADCPRSCHIFHLLRCARELVRTFPEGWRSVLLYAIPISGSHE